MAEENATDASVAPMGATEEAKSSAKSKGSVPLSVVFRAVIERNLEKYGKFVARNSKKVLCTCLLIEILVIVLWVLSGEGIPMETEIAKLWVENGGRLEKEINYVEATRTEGFSGGGNVLMFTRKDGRSDNILSEGMLSDHLKVMRMIYQINETVTHNGTDYFFTLSGAKQNDWLGIIAAEGGSYTTGKYSLCDFVPFPDAILPADNLEYYKSLVPVLTPCNRVTLLDCFREGGEDFFLDPFLLALPLEMREPYGLWGYNSLPSFKGKTAAENLEVAKMGCKGYVSALMEWDVTMLFGSYDTEKITVDGEKVDAVTSAMAFQYIVPFASVEMLMAKFKDEGIDRETLEGLFDRFAVKIEQLITDLTESDELLEANVYVYADNGLNRILAEYSENNFNLVGVGYALMISFIVFAHFDRKAESNMVLTGLFGLATVLLGNVFSLSILVLAGEKMNSTVMQVLPFLALGLGVDDLFVLLSVYREVKRMHPMSPVDMTIGVVMKKGGISVALTSLCNATAFFIATIIPLEAVRVFCIASTLAVVVNFVNIVVTMPCVFALRSHMFQNRRLSKVSADKRKSISQEGAAKLGKKKKTNSYHTAPPSFLTKKYLPFLSSKIVRKFGVSTYLALSIAGAALSTQVEDGLEIVDVVPKSSEVYRSMGVIAKHFKYSPASIVTPDLDYGDPVIQDALIDLMDGLNNIERVQDADAKWIKAMRLHYSGNETAALDAKGPLFREYLHNFTDPVKVTYLDTYQNGMASFGVNDQGDLDYATMSFSITNAGSTSEMVETLEATRDYLLTKCGEGKMIKWCFPTGTIYTFWEQYVKLRTYFFQAIGLCEVAIFCSCLLLLMNWRVAFWVSFFSLCVVMQIFGALSFFSIKFSAIPAVSLIMSVGIAVEFSAHLCVHFDGAVGNREERMKESLYHMFVPIAEGGFSSFLGFSGLAISPFMFIFLYYFMIYFLVVCVGMLNGLFFLPCILSFFGPIAMDR